MHTLKSDQIMCALLLYFEDIALGGICDKFAA